MGVVGDRAQNRQKEDLQQDGQRNHVGKERAGQHGDAQRVDKPVGVGGLLGDGGQVGTEKDGDDGCGEGGCAPVIEIPADLFARL